MQGICLLGELLLYILLARTIVHRLRGTPQQIAFFLVNLAGYAVFLAGPHSDGRYFFALLVYLFIALALYGCMHAFSRANNAQWWFAFASPLVVLIFMRYVPSTAYNHAGAKLHAMVERNAQFTPAVFFIGISYLAFRCSHLVLEVRNGAVAKPDLWTYLGFCFFLPTMTLGPINAYSNYHRGFSADRPDFPIGPAVLRIMIGFIKYLFLGGIFGQLAYSGLLLDDHYHSWIDLPIAAVFYYLFLYCNFSGFCDIAIGGSALIGIPVFENFDQPFAARNMREFWNRWHITLSRYMRDVLFSPLSKALSRTLGPDNVQHAVAISILAVFLVIGIWHGTGWNYAVFGLLQAIGVVTVHYYTLFLKAKLDRQTFKAYNENKWIRAAGVVLTFCYFTASLFFFANSPQDIQRIFAVMK